jgi:hypothetical protein
MLSRVGLKFVGVAAHQSVPCFSCPSLTYIASSRLADATGRATAWVRREETAAALFAAAHAKHEPKETAAVSATLSAERALEGTNSLDGATRDPSLAPELNAQESRLRHLL